MSFAATIAIFLSSCSVSDSSTLEPHYTHYYDDQYMHLTENMESDGADEAKKLFSI